MIPGQLNQGFDMVPMDDQCRHQMGEGSQGQLPAESHHQESQDRSASKRSALFDGGQSSVSPGNQTNLQASSMGQVNEQDSEDPDEEEDSQIMEDRYREFDPQLEARIEAIKK